MPRAIIFSGNNSKLIKDILLARGIWLEVSS